MKRTKKTTRSRKTTGRAAVDWVAAGKKAWATRQRNLAAKGKSKTGKRATNGSKKRTPAPVATPEAVTT